MAEDTTGKGLANGRTPKDKNGTKATLNGEQLKAAEPAAGTEVKPVEALQPAPWRYRHLVESVAAVTIAKLQGTDPAKLAQVFARTGDNGAQQLHLLGSREAVARVAEALRSPDRETHRWELSPEADAASREVVQAHVVEFLRDAIEEAPEPVRLLGDLHAAPKELIPPHAPAETTGLAALAESAEAPEPVGVPAEIPPGSARDNPRAKAENGPGTTPSHPEDRPGLEALLVPALVIGGGVLAVAASRR